MHRAAEAFATFLTDESAASAAEYALVVALVSLVIIVGLGIAGNTLSHLFNHIGNEMTDITP